MPGNETTKVVELHESSMLELGLAIINRKGTAGSTTSKSNDAPLFFTGSFEFFGISFGVVGRGGDDEAWMASRIFLSEIIRNKCKLVKHQVASSAKGKWMVKYICGILIDTCSAISDFYKGKPVIFRLKDVETKRCIAMPGFPAAMKLVVNRMDSEPFLLKEVLESAIADTAPSRGNWHG